MALKSKDGAAVVTEVETTEEQYTEHEVEATEEQHTEHEAMVPVNHNTQDKLPADFYKDTEEESDGYDPEVDHRNEMSEEEIAAYYATLDKGYNVTFRASPVFTMNGNDIDQRLGEEGVDHINVSVGSTNELGKRLAFNYHKPFQSVFGTVICMQRAADYLTHPGYPEKYLNEKSIPRETFQMIKQLPYRLLPNYWAVLFYLLTEKVKADRVLYSMLKKFDTNVILVSYHEEEKSFLSTNYTRKAKVANKNMDIYLGMVRTIIDMIQSGEFNSSGITKMILRLKVDHDLGIFADTALEEEITF